MSNNSDVEKKICRVLIIDDHPMVRNGIRFMLDSKSDRYLFRISEAEDAADTIRKLGSYAFDIILLDYQLPGTHGSELAEQILQVQPDTRILCMSSYNELMNIQKMIHAGAAGYIIKNVGAAELASAIQDILNGKAYYSSAAANKLLEGNRTNPNWQMEDHHKLSPRELEILKLIAIEMTNKEIAEALYLGERTVETHRKNILLKLGVKNTAGLIRAGYELKILP